MLYIILKSRNIKRDKDSQSWRIKRSRKTVATRNRDLGNGEWEITKRGGGEHGTDSLVAVNVYEGSILSIGALIKRVAPFPSRPFLSRDPSWRMSTRSMP